MPPVNFCRSSNLRYALLNAMIIGVFIFLNLFYEVDGYRESFNKVVQVSSIQDIFNIATRDPSFSLLNYLSAKFISFEVFFGALIAASVLLKFYGLLTLNKKPSFLDVLPYIFILGFLHEGIQIRAALALSIVFWSIIHYVRNQKKEAVLFLLLAASFHVSVLIFFIVFLLLELFDRYKKKIFYVVLVSVLAMTFLPGMSDLLLKIGYLLNSRHIYYIGQADQNKTGLYPYYYLFVGTLSFMIWHLFKPKNELWDRMYQLAVASGCLAFSGLVIFHFSVIIASRLADLLLFPLTVIMGALLVQLKLEKKYLHLSLGLLIIIVYGVLRGMISFTPHIILNSNLLHNFLTP